MLEEKHEEDVSVFEREEEEGTSVGGTLVEEAYVVDGLERE